jgi:hypothetical protein
MLLLLLAAADHQRWTADNGGLGRCCACSWCWCCSCWCRRCCRHGVMLSMCCCHVGGASKLLISLLLSAQVFCSYHYVNSTAALAWDADEGVL